MSKNDITGDRLVSKTVTDSFRDNFDRIFKGGTSGTKPSKFESYTDDVAEGAVTDSATDRFDSAAYVSAKGILDTASQMVKDTCGIPEKASQMRTIYFWPDGTWCDQGELGQYLHKSDDYGTLDVSYDLEDSSVDFIVDNVCQGI